MVTIRARKKADGTVSCTVQVRLKKKDALVYQEAQTFARKQLAQESSRTGVKSLRRFCLHWLKPTRRHPSPDLGCGVAEATGPANVIHDLICAYLDRAHVQRIIAITDEGGRAITAMKVSQAYAHHVNGQ